MGCFLGCFGGDGDRRLRRRKSRRQSPARSPPRPNHVPVVHAAAVAADVVVRDASPPLRGAKVSKLPLAVEVPDEAVCGAPAADALAREASPPLLGGKGSKTSPAVEVTNEMIGEALDPTVVKEAFLPSDEAKASVAPPAVAVTANLIPSASPRKELRELSEQEAPSMSSLLPEKKATPPVSPVKSSPVVAAICSQYSVECSSAVAAVVSTPNLELREPSDHGSRSSGKKKVTFNMNVTTYENAATPDQEEGYAEDEVENHTQKIMELPESHRYRNCSDSDDDVDDEYADDDVYGDDSDEEDDFTDCKINLLDEDEISAEENKQESHESLFSLPLSNDQQNDDEVVSPAPKSSGTSVEKESPLIKGNNLFGRSKCVCPVLNPVQNLAEWKEVKSLKSQPMPSKKFDKENVDVLQDVGTSHISNSSNQKKVGASNSSKNEVSVDASLSTWLASSDNLTVDKVQSKSPCSVSSVSQDERSSALIIDELKKSSAASSPSRSPSHNCEGAPIFGTVGSYWSCTKQSNDYCSSRSDSGTNGIPNTTSKYREDKRVNWHSTPFNVRLDRALKKTSA